VTSTENGELIKYFYQFDLFDNLNRATILYDGEKMAIFNRNRELQISIEEYIEINSKEAI